MLPHESMACVCVCRPALKPHHAAGHLLQTTLHYAEVEANIVCPLSLSSCLPFIPQHAFLVVRKVMEHEQRSQRPGAPDESTLESVLHLADCMLAQGDHAASEPVCREALRLSFIIQGQSPLV